MVPTECHQHCSDTYFPFSTARTCTFEASDVPGRPSPRKTRTATLPPDMEVK